MDSLRKKYFDYHRIFLEVRDMINADKINDCLVMFKQLNKYCFDCLKHDEQIRLMENIHRLEYKTMRRHWRILCKNFLDLQPLVDRTVSSKIGFSVNERFYYICHRLKFYIARTPISLDNLAFVQLKAISDSYHTLLLDASEFMVFLNSHEIADTPLFVFWKTDTGERRFPLKAWLMKDKLECETLQLQKLSDKIDT
jgi:hypothetical protein